MVCLCEWVMLWDTYKELVAEGEQQLNAVHLLIGFQRKLQLKDQEVQFPILVLVLFSHLQSAVTEEQSRLYCY